MKAYTIDNFKSRLTNGLAKSNLWRVEIPTSGISNDISMETLNFMCKSIQLPGRQILTADKLIGMFNEKVAYGFAVPDVNLNFHVTNDYTVKRFFEAWQRASVNTGSIGVSVTPEIGFKKVGKWSFENSSFQYELHENYTTKNILYSFVIEDEIKYIGKSIKTISQRLNGYRRPNISQRTNFRLNNQLLKN